MKCFTECLIFWGQHLKLLKEKKSDLEILEVVNVFLTSRVQLAENYAHIPVY